MLIASGTEILWRVSLKFKLSLATSRFHCHRFNVDILWGFPVFFTDTFFGNESVVK